MATTQDIQGGVLSVYKDRGETPLERIDRFKTAHPEFKNVKMTYAGRLDPMAEGVLLIVYGEEITHKEKYLNLDKEYEFDLLFGVETDTYDVLGKIANKEMGIQNSESGPSEFSIQTELKKLVGKRMQEYPPYSSKTVLGRPLFDWARAGELESISIPKREVEVYSLELVKSREVKASEFKKQLFLDLSHMKGDFRQKEIKEKWQKFLENLEKETLTIFTFSIHSSSGTYVREIANLLGKSLDLGAIATRILRRRVGEYTLYNTLS